MTGGPITGAGTLSVNFAGTGSATTAAKSDHSHDAVYQKHYGAVAVVAISGGDYTSPVTAMTDIATWCGTPSASNPCLMKIMPGVYNIGLDSLTIPRFVDVEGSGENTTKITGNRGWGLVHGDSNSEIRFLTVENGGVVSTTAVAILTASSAPLADPFKITHVTAIANGTDVNDAIYNDTPVALGLSPTMTNVTATASGGTGDNIGVLFSSASPTMTNVTATASGGTRAVGVFNSGSSPTMTNVTATASSGTDNYGIFNNGSGTVKIDHSAISGTTNSIYNGASVTTYVGATRVEGGAVSNAGTLTCVGAYNASYVAMTTWCL